ncbi:hypothetical protein RZN22_13430 [Bacillaceae bacterium S4-13-58]
MVLPEEFFQTLELVENARWSPAIKNAFDGYSRGSYVEVGNDDGGPCIGKYGKYHVFTRIGVSKQMWVVNKETKEVRKVPLKYKRKDLKEIFS